MTQTPDQYQILEPQEIPEVKTVQLVDTSTYIVTEFTGTDEEIASQTADDPLSIYEGETEIGWDDKTYAAGHAPVVPESFYALDRETHVVNVWHGAQAYKWAHDGTMGVWLYDGDVEQGYDGLLYEAGHAPTQTQEQINAARIAEIDARLAVLDTKSIRPSRNLAAGVNEESVIDGVTVTDEDALREIREEVATLRAERAMLSPQKTNEPEEVHA